MKIPFIPKIFKYFQICYFYAGNRLLILSAIIFISGLLDGLGLVLVFPLLSSDASNNKLGQFLEQFFLFLGLEQTTANTLILITMVFSLKGFFTFLQSSVVGKMTTDISKEIRQNLVEKYYSMNYSFYTNTNIGYLNNIITKEADRAVGAISIYCRLLVCIIYISIYVPGAALINPSLTLLIMFVSVFFVSILRPLNRASRKTSLEISHKNAEMQSLLIQIIAHFKYIKATSSFSSLHKQLNRNIHRHARLTFLLIMLGAIVSSLMEPFAVILVASMIYLEVVVSGKPIAEILILMAYLYRALGEVFMLQINWQKFNGALGGIETVEEARKSLEANKESWGKQKLENFDKEIVFSEVSFSYGEKPVLCDLNIKIQKNECVGIVGSSGAGKTTLFDLLTALLIPQKGKIKIDEVDYQEIDQRSLRSIVGYVTQDPVMFNDTIANNISLWNSSSSEDHDLLEKSAHSANCRDFIMETSDGYETIIGDSGVKLSGGQRQRLAIARELFKKPQILIFDEATSSLDSESEKHIQESIDKIKGSCTLVIISHRLSTIRNCDRIYVLDKQKVVEEGNFEDLYTREASLFRKMCQNQNLTLELSSPSREL